MWIHGERSEYHGYKFDSQKEMAFYQRFLEKYDNDPNSKFIVKIHPSFSIIDSCELEPRLKIRGAKFTPDAIIEDKQGGLLHVYDVKNSFSAYGVDQAAKLRFKLFTQKYGVPVEAVVVRKNDFKVKIYGTTKKTQEHIFKDIDYDWQEAAR